jgi:hypothetical protein
LKKAYEKTISSDKASLRKIQSEIDKLNKMGLDAYLKREDVEPAKPIVSETVAKKKIKVGEAITDTGNFNVPYVESYKLDTKYALPKPGEIKGIISQIVKATPDGLNTIKKKLENRYPKAAALIDEITKTEGLLNKVKEARREQWQQLQDQTIKKITDAGEVPIYQWVNGVREVYSVPAEMGNFLKGLNQTSKGTLLKIADSLNRGFKAGTTGVNPGFAITNIIRDLGSNFINTKHGWRLLNPFNMARAVSDSMFSALGIKSEKIAEINKMGGFDTSFDIFKPGEEKVGIDKIRAQKNWITKAEYAAKHPMQTLQAIVGFSEKPVRYGVYNVSKTQYMKQKDANGNRLYSDETAKAMAYQDALMGSANFSRQGIYAPAIRSLYPYLPAALRGTASFRRGLKENNTLGSAARVSAFLLMPSIASTSWNLSDPERADILADISPHIKNNYFVWIFPGAKKQPDKTYSNVFMLPKPSGLGVLTAPFEKTMEAMVRGGDYPSALEVISAVQEPLTTIDWTSKEKIMSTFVPQAVKPLAELGLNENFLTGAPAYNEKVDMARQYVPGETSGLLRKTGGFLGQGPQSLQYLIKGYTGEVGLNVINLADQAAAAIGIISPEEVGGRSIQDTLTRRFVEPKGGEIESKMYDKVGAAKATDEGNKKVAREISDRAIQKMKEGDASGARAIMQEVNKDYREYALDYIKKEKKKAQSGTTPISSMSAKVAVEYLKNAINSGDIKTKDELKEFIKSLDSQEARAADIEYAS